MRSKNFIKWTISWGVLLTSLFLNYKNINNKTEGKLKNKLEEIVKRRPSFSVPIFGDKIEATMADKKLIKKYKELDLPEDVKKLFLNPNEIPFGFKLVDFQYWTPIDFQNAFYDTHHIFYYRNHKDYMDDFLILVYGKGPTKSKRYGESLSEIEDHLQIISFKYNFADPVGIYRIFIEEPQEWLSCYVLCGNEEKKRMVLISLPAIVSEEAKHDLNKFLEEGKKLWNTYIIPYCQRNEIKIYKDPFEPIEAPPVPPPPNN